MIVCVCVCVRVAHFFGKVFRTHEVSAASAGLALQVPLHLNCEASHGPRSPPRIFIKNKATLHVSVRIFFFFFLSLQPDCSWGQVEHDKLATSDSIFCSQRKGAEKQLNCVTALQLLGRRPNIYVYIYELFLGLSVD